MATEEDVAKEKRLPFNVEACQKRWQEMHEGMMEDLKKIRSKETNLNHMHRQEANLRAEEMSEQERNSAASIKKEDSKSATTKEKASESTAIKREDSVPIKEETPESANGS
jgi:hypothetical protein